MIFLTEHNLPFTAALVLMALIGLLQIVGLFGFDIEPEADIGGDGLLDSFATLAGLGRVPFMIWLAGLLLLFAGFGLSIQAIVDAASGEPLPAWIAALAAFLAALPANSLLVRPLARILPGDETTAVDLDSLLGRRAVISIGTARAKFPARARVKDRFGFAHHVMVEPHDMAGEILEGETVLLVRREQGIFYGLPLQDRRLAPTE